MRLIKTIFYRMIVLFLIFMLTFTPAGRGKKLYSANVPAEASDLHILMLKFAPSNPMIGEVVSIELVVENLGNAPSTQTRVSIDWCCSGITREVPVINAGESFSVKFENALVFNEPGSYEITALADCDFIVVESSESNNSKTETLSIRLREEKGFVGDPEKWGGEWNEILCPETDLLKIGRKIPYLTEDLCPGIWGTEQGCPKVDKDGDGLFENPSWLAQDKCPDEPGPGGDREDKGCPVKGTTGDRDSDGVADSQDNCPDDWGFADNHGCPKPDRDGDGILDSQDNCPDSPGPAPDGCPISGPANDSEGDGFIEDRLSKLCDACNRDDDQEKDLGCQVYLRGQRPNACGTTCLAYILRYFGKDVWPDDVDEELRGTRITDMFSEPMGIHDFAKMYGLNSEIYINGDLEEVRTLVERGIPVMLDISNTAGSTDVMNGHWVVVLSFCEVPQSTSSGTLQTVVQFYDPNGVQFRTTPDRLEEFWGNMELWGAFLWSRLYIAISDKPLPVGNSGEVSEKIATARGVSEVMAGLDDIADGNIIDGLISVGGGTFSGILGLVGTVLSWGEDVPLIGGFLGAMGDFCGNIAQASSKIFDSIGDIFDPDTWSDPERLGAVLLSLIEGIADAIVAVFEFIWDTIVEGIVGFFESIIDGIKELGCDWFGWWCPDIVVYYKHFVSTDSCLETTTFINGLHRVKALGYIYTYPAPDTKPLWLYSAPASEIKIPIQANEGLAVGDVNGDGVYEIIHGDRSDDKIYIFDMNGNKISEPFDVGYEQEDRIAAGEVNNDGKDEIILADDSKNSIRIFTMDGEEIKTLSNPCGIGDIQANEGLAVGDVNGDGVYEIIHGDRSDDKIYIFDMNGNKISEPFDVGYEQEDRIAAGEVNNDGKDEIILADDSKDWINIFDMNGNKLQKYALSNSNNLSDDDPNYLNLGIIGYTLVSDTGELYNLNNEASEIGIFVKGDLGFLLKEPCEGTSILWSMQSVFNKAFSVSTDPCALTQTFLNPLAKLYTREAALCLIPNSETPGATKLYRFYDDKNQDCMLSINGAEIEHYVNQGYVGYIFTEQKPGTVPLYQFYNNKRKDHLTTLDLDAEGLNNYNAYEVLGYVLPLSDITQEDWKCYVPLWRFCKRVVKEE